MVFADLSVGVALNSYDSTSDTPIYSTSLSARSFNRKEKVCCHDGMNRKVTARDLNMSWVRLQMGGHLVTSDLEEKELYS